MFKRTFQLLLVTFLLMDTLWAAIDTLVDDWKPNPSRSKLTDLMKIESLGGNKYAFDFGTGPEKIAADGTDQSGVYATMLSLPLREPDTWKAVRKKEGRILLTATWKLSPDGNTLGDNYTQFGPKGSPSTVNYLYQRTAARTGSAGTWESTMPIDSAFVLQIRPYQENGLSFINSSEEVTRNVKFDGKDHPNLGHGVAEGSTLSARKVDERILEITDKIKCKITRTEQIEFSPKLKTLTRTVRQVGQRGPNIFVFERQ